MSWNADVASLPNQNNNTNSRAVGIITELHQLACERAVLLSVQHIHTQ